jgi:hypothetical protein
MTADPGRTPTWVPALRRDSGMRPGDHIAGIDMGPLSTPLLRPRIQPWERQWKM